MLGHHPLPEEVEDALRELQEDSHNAHVTGPSTRKRMQVETPLQGNRVFLERAEGFFVTEEGDFLKDQQDTYGTLDCGCSVASPQEVGGSDYLTGEVVCSQHLSSCQKCHRPVAFHNARTILEAQYCQPCVRRMIREKILLFPWKMIKAIFYGLGGLEVTDDGSPTLSELL
ncbi:MAG: hypothetical protein ABIG67_02810 [Pseudomonadota bacterium]